MLSMFLRLIYVTIAIICVVLAYKSWTYRSAVNYLEKASFENYIGPEDAEITIVEFLDYHCQPCRETQLEIEEFHKQHPDIKIVFINALIYGDKSVPEARLAVASGLQNKYYDAHTAIMARGQPIDDFFVQDFAEEKGLDFEKLRKDMDAVEVNRHLYRSDSATTHTKIKSVPSFLINGYVFYPEDRVPTGAELEKWLKIATE